MARKKLTKAEKKQQLFLFVQGKHVTRHGGIKKAQEKATKFLEDDGN